MVIIFERICSKNFLKRISFYILIYVFLQKLNIRAFQKNFSLCLSILRCRVIIGFEHVDTRKWPFYRRVYSSSFVRVSVSLALR